MYTKLEKTESSFAERMKHFGVVTVRNAKIYDVDDYNKLANVSAYQIAHAAKTATGNEIIVQAGSSQNKDKDPKLTYRGEIDTLKTASISTDGPTKTITGGQYNEPLLKYGKTITVSRQDALGDHKALEALCGTVSEYSDLSKPTTINESNLIGRHITPQFATAKRIIGDSFFVNQKTGETVKVNIMLYKFLPDSLFNLAQEADGDAAVFDRNGTLVPVEIQVGQSDGHSEPEQVFWSVIDPAKDTKANPTTAPTGATGATGATGK